MSALYGNSVNLYAVAYLGSNRGSVLRYDGVGWNIESIPMGTPALEAIWVAASGEVFAVGSSGTVITGP